MGKSNFYDYHYRETLMLMRDVGRRRWRYLVVRNFGRRNLQIDRNLRLGLVHFLRPQQACSLQSIPIFRERQ